MNKLRRTVAWELFGRFISPFHIYCFKLSGLGDTCVQSGWYASHISAGVLNCALRRRFLYMINDCYYTENFLPILRQPRNRIYVRWQNEYIWTLQPVVCSCGHVCAEHKSQARTYLSSRLCSKTPRTKTFQVFDLNGQLSYYTESKVSGFNQVLYPEQNLL